MDIEKLTKSQIVLLTLLVSFVTSIATGIVTVSLMQQAPPVVAQTVNRVIEHTIETVASSTPTAQPAAAVQSTDPAGLVAQAVKNISPSVVRLYSEGGTPQFLAIGLVLDKSGTVLTDSGALGTTTRVSTRLPDGTDEAEVLASSESASGFAYLSPATSTPDAASAEWVPASLAAENPALGALVVAIAGEDAPHVAEGIVTQITSADATSGVPEIIDTDIGPSSLLPGAVLIDGDGDVVGVSVAASRASSPSGFIPSALMKEPTH